VSQQIENDMHPSAILPVQEYTYYETIQSEWNLDVVPSSGYADIPSRIVMVAILLWP
jgi:hypothetical protein